MIAVSLAACSPGSASPAEIADRGWRAHEIVMAAGEGAATCRAAGIAMQHVYALLRADFAAAMALDRDPRRLREATEYLEAHQDRYADLETRMAALADRCPDDPGVQATFTAMASP